MNCEGRQTVVIFVVIVIIVLSRRIVSATTDEIVGISAVRLLMSMEFENRGSEFQLLVWV